MFGAELFCNFNFTCFKRQQRNRKIFMPRKFLTFSKNKSNFPCGYVKLSENSNF